MCHPPWQLRGLVNVNSQVVDACRLRRQLRRFKWWILSPVQSYEQGNIASCCQGIHVWYLNQCQCHQGHSPRSRPKSYLINMHDPLIQYPALRECSQLLDSFQADHWPVCDLMYSLCSNLTHFAITTCTMRCTLWRDMVCPGEVDENCVHFEIKKFAIRLFRSLWMGHNRLRLFFLLNMLEDISPLWGATDTTVLDFWWHLWISKPEWEALFMLGRGIHVKCSLRFNSRVTSANLLVASMAAEPSLPHTCEQPVTFLRGTKP